MCFNGSENWAKRSNQISVFEAQQCFALYWNDSKSRHWPLISSGRSWPPTYTRWKTIVSEEKGICLVRREVLLGCVRGRGWRRGWDGTRGAAERAGSHESTRKRVDWWEPTMAVVNSPPPPHTRPTTPPPLWITSNYYHPWKTVPPAGGEERQQHHLMMLFVTSEEPLLENSRCCPNAALFYPFQAKARFWHREKSHGTLTTRSITKWHFLA